MNIPSGYVAKLTIKLFIVLDIISTLPNQKASEENITDILTIVKVPSIENSINSVKLFKIKMTQIKSYINFLSYYSKYVLEITITGRTP